MIDLCPACSRVQPRCPHRSRARPPRSSHLRLYDLHDKIVDYERAWEWQKRYVVALADARDVGGVPEALAVLQHAPTYTLGTGSSLENIKFDIKNPPHPLYRTERGGEVTFHGPGQLTVYPILDLKRHGQDLHLYLRALEEVIMRALYSVSGIAAFRIEGLTGVRPEPAAEKKLQLLYRCKRPCHVSHAPGWDSLDTPRQMKQTLQAGVWTATGKIAATGVRATRWVSYHGIALNVCSDLSNFGDIIPCGISGRPVTSVIQHICTQRSVVDQSTAGRDRPSLQQGMLLGKCQEEEAQLLTEYAAAIVEAVEHQFSLSVTETVCDLGIPERRWPVTDVL